MYDIRLQMILFNSAVMSEIVNNDIGRYIAEMIALSVLSEIKYDQGHNMGIPHTSYDNSSVVGCMFVFQIKRGVNHGTFTLHPGGL